MRRQWWAGHIVKLDPAISYGGQRGKARQCNERRFVIAPWFKEEMKWALVLGSQLRPTTFGELTKDIGFSTEVRSRLSVELWRVIGFDDPLHDPLGGFYRSIGRK